MFKKSSVRSQEIIVVLCDIRSVHNAGAIMRTADAIGATRIIFCGVTPSPLDRFGRVRADFIKASLGSEKTLPFETSRDSRAAVDTLKKQGVYVVAVEQGTAAVDYKEVEIPSQRSVAVLFGSETEGLPKNIRSLSDVVAEIPMRGKKESLNVSVAAGIALYRFFDRC